MTNEAILLIVTGVSGAYMAGVIWFVQLVHYPLMGEVGKLGDQAWKTYHAGHSWWTTVVVGLPMCAELLSGIGLVWVNPGEVWVWVQGGLVVGIWAVTGAVQVRQHGKLEQGFDEAVHRGLVRGNWIRTVLWTVRVGVLVWGGMSLGMSRQGG